MDKTKEEKRTRRLKLLAQRSGFAMHGIEFLLLDRTFDDKLSKAKYIEFEPYDEQIYIDPTFHLEIAEAQSLIDNLWECGLRPTNITNVSGEVAAVKEHLGDMRKLSQRLLDKVLMDQP